MPDWWELTYGFNPNDAGDAHLDTDGDGMSNLQEFMSGTDPTNSASAFRIIAIAQEGDDVRVTWATAGGRTNVLQAASSLSGVYFNISSNIVISGVGDVVTNYLDKGAVTNATCRFYRVALRAVSIQETNAPTVAITSPADNSLITNSTVTVTGTSADLSGVAGVEVHGIAASSADGYSNWVAVVTGLSDGTNTLTVLAGDNAAPANLATNLVRVICATGSFDGNGDGLPDGWQIKYFGVVNAPGSGPDDDPDGDGMININEFLAGFVPTNGAALLRIMGIEKSGNDISVTYLGANGDTTYSGGPESRTNVLESTAGTANGSYTNTFVSTGQTNILSGGTGLGAVTNMVEVGGATNNPAWYYRVRVLVP